MKGNEYLFLEVAMVTNPFLKVIHFRFKKKKSGFCRQSLSVLALLGGGRKRGLLLLSVWTMDALPLLNKPSQVLSEPMQ